MFSRFEVLATVTCYIILLFSAAYWVERRKDRGQSWHNQSWIYSLSLAVYCTSWTYYGSVGSATKSGMLFLAIYLGPMLSMTLWSSILIKMIHLKERYRLTSAVDLISARFDKSTAIGVYASVFLVFGIIPYIALQLKSLYSSWSLLSDTHLVDNSAAQEIPSLFTSTGLFTVAILSLTTIFFGIRKLDSTERHPGMIFILAVECIVKLVAFIAVGVFATYYLNDGFGSVLDKLPNLVNSETYNFMGDSKNTLVDLTTWLTYIILASSAILMLPRQFHVSVTENVNVKHVNKARWQFPIYLFLINLFVLPIAVTGLELKLPPQLADFTVLALALKSENQILTLITFIGGISAAVGMIAIETMALSTILSNSLLVPIIARVPSLSFLTKRILQMRWIAATAIISISYWYMSVVGSKYALVAMGMISFSAVLQLAPSIIAGLYWKRASKVGAFLGLIWGSSIWFYTLMVPALAKSEWISSEILQIGPFGIEMLAPEKLLGINQFHYLTHSLLWTMLGNIGGIIIGSYLFPQSRTENQIAEDFININDSEDEEIDLINTSEHDILVNKNEKLDVILGILSKYFEREKAQKILLDIKNNSKCKSGDHISLIELSDMRAQVERVLSGFIGTSGANFELNNSDLFTLNEQDNLNKMYSTILTNMKINPKELNKKIILFQEKQKLMEQEQRHLEERIEQKSLELENQKHKTFMASKLSALGEMSAGIAHEINNPLTIISSSASYLAKGLEKDKLTKEQILASIDKIKATVLRISRIIQGMRNIARDTEGELFEKTNLKSILEDAISLCDQKFKNMSIEIKVDLEDPNFNTSISCKRIGISQVFVNLLNNSHDAICTLDSKWISISSKVNTEHQEIEIKFTDSGNGIPVEIRDKILQPFFTTKEIGKGTGLGLSLCNNIIKEHKGNFYIDESNPNTCFIIKIPLLTEDLTIKEKVA
jgi:Na+/proline symporter/signal transduction histidine kinase